MVLCFRPSAFSPRRQGIDDEALRNQEWQACIASPFCASYDSFE
jgi:hypothetical protein